MYTTTIKNKEYTVYEEGDLIPFLAIPPGFGIGRELEAREICHSVAAQKLGITEIQLEQLIIGDLKVTPEIAMRLEQMGFVTADYWLRRQAHYENHPKHPSRGGARPNSGPKALGHSTKQVRITAPLEDMEIITTWLKSQKNASRAIAQLIKEHATRAT